MHLLEVAQRFIWESPFKSNYQFNCQQKQMTIHCKKSPETSTDKDCSLWNEIEIPCQSYYKFWMRKDVFIQSFTHDEELYSEKAGDQSQTENNIEHQ